MHCIAKTLLTELHLVIPTSATERAYRSACLCAFSYITVIVVVVVVLSRLTRRRHRILGRWCDRSKMVVVENRN